MLYTFNVIADITRHLELKHASRCAWCAC